LKLADKMSTRKNNGAAEKVVICACGCGDSAPMIDMQPCQKCKQNYCKLKPCWSICSTCSKAEKARQAEEAEKVRQPEESEKARLADEP